MRRKAMITYSSPLSTIYSVIKAVFEILKKIKDERRNK